MKEKLYHRSLITLDRNMQRRQNALIRTVIDIHTLFQQPLGDGTMTGQYGIMEWAMVALWISSIKEGVRHDHKSRRTLACREGALYS